MNKKLTKIVGVTLGLSMAVGAGAGIVAFVSSNAKPVYATEDSATYQHIFNAKPSVANNVSLSGVNWNISATNLGSYNSGNYAGVQIGSSSKNGSITLTSTYNWGAQESASSYFGKTAITEVRLWLNLGGTSVTPSVTIGGTAAVSDGTTVVKNSSAGSDYTKATLVTFTPAADHNTGSVVINVETVKAGYICAMEIDCETSSGGVDPVDTHEVAFNSMGGSTIDTQHVVDGGFVNPLLEPTKAKDTANKIRFVFEGWYLNSNFTGDKFTSTTPVESDITLYANYTEIHYNVVSFNTNGGNNIYSQDVDAGEKVARPNEPLKDDYFFLGWYTTEACTDGTEFNFDSTIIENNITLYAKWELATIQETGLFVKVTRVEDLVNGGKYLFVYDSKAFDGSLANLDSTPNTVDVVFENGRIRKDDNTASAYFVIDTVNGYIKASSSKYIGRTEYSNGLNTAANPSSFSNYQNNISFSEGNVVVTREVEAGKIVTLSFNSAADQMKFRYFKTPSSDIQLYRFVNGHTVTFNTNGGSSISSVDVLHGETLTLPANPTKPSDANYTYAFEGWYTNEGLTSAFNASSPITSDLTLYAKYTKEEIDNPEAYLDDASSLALLYGVETSNTQKLTKEIVFEDLGLTNGAQYLDPFDGDGFTITFAGGSNDGKYYTTGTGMRTYGGGSLTIAASNITKITLTWDGSYAPSADDVVDGGAYDHSTNIWTGSEDSVTFTRPSGSGHWRLQSVEVVFDGQVYSVGSVALRFGASIPEAKWNSIETKWGVDDYGVMLLKKTTLDNNANYSTVNSVAEAFNAGKPVSNIHKGSGAAPLLENGNYYFTAKVSISNSSEYGIVLRAVPYIVVDDTYYFMEEVEYSVSSLATYCKSHSDNSNLSNAALSTLE